MGLPKARVDSITLQTLQSACRPHHRLTTTIKTLNPPQQPRIHGLPPTPAPTQQDPMMYKMVPRHSESGRSSQASSILLKPTLGFPVALRQAPDSSSKGPTQTPSNSFSTLHTWALFTPAQTLHTWAFFTPGHSSHLGILHWALCTPGHSAHLGTLHTWALFTPAHSSHLHTLHTTCTLCTPAHFAHSAHLRTLHTYTSKKQVLQPSSLTSSQGWPMTLHLTPPDTQLTPRPCMPSTSP